MIESASIFRPRIVSSLQVDKTRAIREGMARQTEEIKKQAKVVKHELDYLDALNERALQKPVRTPRLPTRHPYRTRCNMI